MVNSCRSTTTTVHVQHTAAKRSYLHFVSVSAEQTSTGRFAPHKSSLLTFFQESKLKLEVDKFSGIVKYTSTKYPST